MGIQQKNNGRIFIKHQHAFDKLTYQPIGTMKLPMEEKKEDVPELIAENFNEIDAFINTL
jgi:hypothetical protein